MDPRKLDEKRGPFTSHLVYATRQGHVYVFDLHALGGNPTRLRAFIDNPQNQRVVLNIAEERMALDNTFGGERVKLSHQGATIAPQVPGLPPPRYGYIPSRLGRARGVRELIQPFQGADRDDTWLLTVLLYAGPEVAYIHVGDECVRRWAKRFPRPIRLLVEGRSPPIAPGSRSQRAVQ